MTPFPAPNRLHVWWARRPLVASRAAVLASLLPADADRTTFMHVLGIHGNPVKAQLELKRAQRSGVRISNPYGYERAFKYFPSRSEREWISAESQRAGGRDPIVLDPTAGGGSIPFETVRLGRACVANDLNPVAALILRATVEWPLTHGAALFDIFRRLSAEWRKRLEARLAPYFPQPGAPDRIDATS